VTTGWLLIGAATIAFLAGFWWNSIANKKAKEPFAPPTSAADYCAIFLWVLATALLVMAVMVSR
jgi:hypothetical protein